MTPPCPLRGQEEKDKNLKTSHYRHMVLQKKLPYIDNQVPKEFDLSPIAGTKNINYI